MSNESTVAQLTQARRIAEAQGRGWSFHPSADVLHVHIPESVLSALPEGKRTPRYGIVSTVYQALAFVDGYEMCARHILTKIDDASPEKGE